MSLITNITNSGIVLTGQGKLKGLVVNSHTSGTVKIYDGLEASVVAVGTITQSVGAATPASHATSALTSTGAYVPGTHAVTVFTKSSAQFLDATKASAILTSDQTQPTATKVVVLGGTTYTFTALGGASTRTATAVSVPLGNTCAETMNNLFNAMERQSDTDLVDVVRTSTYVITVTAKTAGTAGNSIVATEDDAHLDWDGSNTTLTGGTAAETITIGSKVYTWKTTIDSTLATATAINVLIGSSLTISLANLRKAINATGTPGLEYSFGAVKDPSIVASVSDATTVTLRGRVPGTSLNTVATTETCATGSFPDTTLGGGTGASDAGTTTGAATVTIGTTVYTFVDALSETYGATAVAYQVLAGANVAASLDNLKLAINGTGTAGTEYSTGTVAHTLVVATTNTDTAQTIRGRVVGASLDATATTETLANTTWADTTLGGGTGVSDPGVATTAATITINGRVYTAVVELTETLVGTAGAVADQILWVTDEATFLDNLKAAINLSGTIGTDYSTGTTVNKDVIATTNAATTQVIQSRLNGVVGNAITTTATLTNYAWGGTVLASGAGVTNKVLFNTITLGTITAGIDRMLNLGGTDGVDFTRGIYITVGGTLDASVLYDLN